MTLAEELIALHQSPREVPPFTDRYPDLTAEEGYKAAAALHQHRLNAGWHPAGRKIGFTNKTIWPRYGIYEPMWGWVYDKTLLHARDNQVIVPLAGLINPRIEPEIAFKLKSAPGQDLIQSIEWVAHSIEIVQTYHPGWRFKLPDCTAANGLHARLVVGTPVPISEIEGIEQRLPEAKVTLSKEGNVVDTGVGANVLGSPLLALAAFVQLLTKHPPEVALKAGEIITTGVLTDAHDVAPSQTWQTAFERLPLPGLTVTFS
jgi:2-keto-4-pentenoate hydratase